MNVRSGSDDACLTRHFLSWVMLTGESVWTTATTHARGISCTIAYCAIPFQCTKTRATSVFAGDLSRQATFDTTLAANQHHVHHQRPHLGLLQSHALDIFRGVLLRTLEARHDGGRVSRPTSQLHREAAGLAVSSMPHEYNPWCLRRNGRRVQFAELGPRRCHRSSEYHV